MAKEKNKMLHGKKSSLNGLRVGVVLYCVWLCCIFKKLRKLSMV